MRHLRREGMRRYLMPQGAEVALRQKENVVLLRLLEEAHGNNSGPEGKLHCGNANCQYLHALPKNADEEKELQERHEKQQEK